MLPVAIVDTPILNVRSGPGTGFGIVTTISQGTWAQIIGVNPGADWFQVELYGVTGQTLALPQPYKSCRSSCWCYADLSSSTVAAADRGATRLLQADHNSGVSLYRGGAPYPADYGEFDYG